MIGTSAAVVTGVDRSVDQMRRSSLSAPVIAGGAAILVLPILADLARNYWTTPAGAQAPLILISGLWLIWRERGALHFAPGSVDGRWLALLAPLGLLYLFARAMHLLGSEAIAVLGILLLLGCYCFGARAMRGVWFIWVYLAFLIKPPQGLVTALTGPLQLGLSSTAVRLLELFDYPIGGSGVSIQIGQYELLIAQACAGLGSLFALSAIGLLYVHLARPATRVHRLALLAGIVPIAVLANLARVITIILLTYHAGDAVAQSAWHGFAGVGTFILSLMGLGLLDALLGRSMRSAR